LLNQIGDTLYQGEDPTQIYHLESPFEVEDIENGYKVRLKIPFIQNNDFTLKKFGDELIINIKNQRKSVFLPKFANYMKVEGYEHDDPWLVIYLKKSWVKWSLNKTYKACNDQLLRLI